MSRNLDPITIGSGIGLKEIRHCKLQSLVMPGNEASHTLAPKETVNRFCELTNFGDSEMSHAACTEERSIRHDKTLND